MTALQFLWFILIGVLFAGFFFLDGFDYGVGMATKTLAQNDAERTQLIRTIGPVWDGMKFGSSLLVGQCLLLSLTGMHPYSQDTT